MTDRKKILKLLQLAATILLLSYLIIRWGYSLKTLKSDIQAPLWLLPCIINAVLLTPFLAGWRWQIVLRAVNVKIRLSKLIKFNFLSIFWGVMLPSSDGFAFIRMVLVAHSYPEIKEKTIGSIVLEKFFGILILLTTALIAGFFPGHPQTGKLQSILIVLLATMLGLVSLVALMPELKDTVTGNSILRRVLRFIRLLLLSWKKADKKKLAAAALLILSVQIMSYFVIYCLFRFMGYNLPMINHFCLIPIIQVISLLPFTVAGFGIREGAFIYFYQQFGIPAQSLITLSLLNFLIQAGIPALIGGILSLAIHTSPPGKRE